MNIMELWSDQTKFQNLFFGTRNLKNWKFVFWFVQIALTVFRKMFHFPLFKHKGSNFHLIKTVPQNLQTWIFKQFLTLFKITQTRMETLKFVSMRLWTSFLRAGKNYLQLLIWTPYNRTFSTNNLFFHSQNPL